MAVPSAATTINMIAIGVHRLMAWMPQFNGKNRIAWNAFYNRPATVDSGIQSENVLDIELINGFANNSRSNCCSAQQSGYDILNRQQVIL